MEVKSTKIKKHGVLWTVLIWGGIALLLIVGFYCVRRFSGRAPEISYSTFRSLINEVQRVVFIDHEIRGSLKASRELHTLDYETVNSQEFISRVPFEDPGLVDTLVAMGVEVSTQGRSHWYNIVLSIFPWVIIIGFFVILLRSQNKKMERILNALRGEDDK